jgi:hypothetical protein
VVVDRRRRVVVCTGSLAWAVIGATMALSAIPDVNADARVLVGLASFIFPACAVAAAVMLDRRRDRLAGLLLVLSVATPTYFAYPLNLAALIVGLALMAAPHAVLGHRTRLSSE